MKTCNDVPNFLPSLHPGKGERVIDIKKQFPEYSESQIEEALEFLVSEDLAQKYNHGGATLYLKKIES